VSSRIARLSLAALRMAASASVEDTGAVAQWLYHFGTVPRGLRVERDFGPDDDPMAVIGLTVGGRSRRRLEAGYDASTVPGWYSFARAGVPLQLTAACKLYVSPTPAALADAFPRVVDVFVESELRSFKVGRGIEGLLRPDKIVAYFDDRAELDAVAAALARALDACPAQGAPFTSDLAGDGLLSWGIDPPPGSEAVSWRSWVTRRLASSITARRSGSAAERVDAALADIRAAGVDPQCWAPTFHTFGEASVS
jgi:hypothetical protein